MVLKSTGTMNIQEGNFQYSKKTFRAPFKVHCMAVSPVNDIVAIGSRNGDIALKRVSWKQIWKMNISQAAMLLSQTGEQIQLDCLEFSPDGEVLAAATTDGNVCVIDVETGKFKHYCRVGEIGHAVTFQRLRWCPHNRIEHIESGIGRFINEVYLEAESDMKKSIKKIEENKATLYDQCIDLTGSKPDVAKEDIAFVFQMLEEDSSFVKAEEGIEEGIENTFISNRKFRQSYRDTVLLAIRDDLIVSVLLAGVYPFADIDVTKYLAPMNLIPIYVYDAYYSRSSGGVSIVVTSCGPKPTLDKAKNFGKPIAEKAGKNGNHTHVINFKLAIQEVHWDLALRFIRLVYGFFLMYLSFETSHKNWETQLMILHNRFDTKIPNVRIGEILLDMLLSGSTEPAGEQFLERGLGVEGLAGINEFIEKHLIEVGRITRGQLVAAVRNLSFQVNEFVMAVNRIYDEERFELYTDELLTMKFDDPKMPPQAVKRREMNSAILNLERDIARIEMKTKQLQLSCAIMIQELSQLTKWLAMLKPFSRGVKANVLLRSKRMDIRQVVSYIVNNFITDPTQKDFYNLVMFKIENLVQRLNAHDISTQFDELKYFEDAKNDAQQLHNVYKEELKQLRPDMAEFNNKHEEMMMNSATEMKKRPQADESRPQPGQHQYPIDLDTVGSFFQDQLSMKASTRVPYVNPLLIDVDSDIYEKNTRGLDRARTLGFAKIIHSMAEAIQATRRMIDSTPKTDKSNFSIQWFFEVDSGPQHSGYENCRISTLYHEASVADPLFKSREPLKRALHVICSSEKQFSSNFLVTPCEWEYDGISKEVGPLEEFAKIYNFEVDANPTVREPTRRNEERMDVDENELSIEIESRQMKNRFDQFAGFHQVYSVFDGEMIVSASFKTNDESGGVCRRLIKFESDHGNENNWIVQNDSWGTSEIVESSSVCQYMRRGMYTYDEGTRVAIYYYEPNRDLRQRAAAAAAAEAREMTDEQGTSSGGGQSEKRPTTYREFQIRRERLRSMIPYQYAQMNQFDDIIEECIDADAPEEMLREILSKRP